MPKKAVPAKKATPRAKAAPVTRKKAAAPVQKRAAKKAAPKKAAPPARKAAKKAALAKKAAPPAKKAAKRAPPAKKPSTVRRAPPAARAPARKPAPASRPPASRPPADKFLAEQQALLQQERAMYVEQADSLKAEADQLAQEMEPGDIQFDEESGEGGTMAVDRERDLALSAQARAAVEEIDHALARIAKGTYGQCERCGQQIPKARLRALPFARLCVACKSGGLSRR